MILACWMCWGFLCSRAINGTPKSHQSVLVLVNNVFSQLNLCKHGGFMYDTLFSETVQTEKLCTQIKKPGRFALFHVHYIEGDALLGRESIQVDCFTLICCSWSINFSIQKIDSSELNSWRLQHFSLNLFEVPRARVSENNLFGLYELRRNESE